MSIVDRPAQVDVIERQVETEVSAPDKFMGVGGAFEKDLVDMQSCQGVAWGSMLMSLHRCGTLEKLQFTKVDAIITGDLSSGRVSQAEAEATDQDDIGGHGESRMCAQAGYCIGKR